MAKDDVYIALQPIGSLEDGGRPTQPLGEWNPSGVVDLSNYPPETIQKFLDREFIRKATAEDKKRIAELSAVKDN